MKLEDWEKEASGRWPKRIKEIRAIVDLCEDTYYRSDNTVLTLDKFRYIEFDLGIAMMWNSGTTVEKLVFIGGNNEIFDLQRRSRNDKIPRGSSGQIDSIMKVIEGIYYGKKKAVDSAIAELTGNKRAKSFAKMKSLPKPKKKVYKRRRA